MHRSRLILGCMALVLMLALLIPLVGCGGGEESPTSSPTGTSTGATTTKSPTATKTSSSENTLSDIFGGGKNLGDVQFDMVMTSPQLPQAMTQKVYYKSFGTNQFKSRTEMTAEGMTTIYLTDESTQTAYMWMVEQNIAYRINWSQAPSNPTEGGDQIHPTHVGTATIDGHPCDIWQWTSQGTTEKMWIWTAKSFPVKMEATTSSGTSTTEYKNIVFGTLSNDLFQLPSSVQIMQMPGS